MNDEGRQRLRLFLIGLIPALFVGLFLSSVYVNFRDGLTPQAIHGFNVFAFWYETPLYQGRITPGFYRELELIGFSSVIVPLFLTMVFFRPHHQGTARWASFHEMAHAGYIKPYGKIIGPIFGKTTSPGWPGKYLTNGDQPHSLVVAPTRAGKGVGVVIPTLLTFDGSVLALDVKGELFELTSRARKERGDRIYKFAPFDKEGRTHSYNPVLDIVNMPPERRFSETRRLAANLIVPKGKGSEGFIDGARDLFVAGILACIERGNPTIGAVYDLFTQPGEKYKLFAQLAEESKDPEAQRIFDNMAGNDTKILTSYTSVLGDGGLNLWADPLIKAATTTSDFSIYDLRRDPTSIYLCVSPNDLEVIAPLVRLFFQQVVSILQRSMPQKDETFEVLFLLDEFKHLGKLEAIETAVTTIAGYKGRFMFIIQSLSALTGAYEEAGKENFLSNTGVQVFMATADDETPNYISKAIGDHSYDAHSKSYNEGHFFEANIQISEQGSPLMRPEQIRLLDENTQIVLIKGRPPLMMPKIKYYSDRVLKRLFEGQKGPLPEPEPLDLSAHATAAPVVTIQEQAGQGSAGGDGGFDQGFGTEPAESGPSPYYNAPAEAYAGINAAAQARQNAEQAFAAQQDAMERQRQFEEAAARQSQQVATSNVVPFDPPQPPPPELAAQKALLDRIIALQQLNGTHGIGADVG